ncbi:sensor histidine kinase [Paenibacillus alkalitolerans]|uniref:sensor histidine kinase n=1 Tax=Paenibacillus alkalitolerans TaxID=2799335 RepID=UPI0018F67307|nr:sensor histidine kinase [Paenibacillus alkalitolerans]
MTRQAKTIFPWVNDIPLKYKFLLIYLLCVLVPIISINLLFLNQVSQNIRVREEQNMFISMDRATGEIARLIDEMVGLGYSISKDRALYEALDRTYETRVEYYDVFDSLLRNKLKPNLPVHPGILELGVYTTNPTVESGGEYFYLTDRMRQTDWYKAIAGSRNRVTVIAHEDPQPLLLGKPAKRISILTKMDQYDGYRTYDKFLKIDLNIGKLLEILHVESGFLDIALIDPLDRIVVSGPGWSSGDYSKIPADAENVELSQRYEHKLGNASYLSGWRLVGVSDHRKIAETLYESRRFIFWLAVISTIVPTVLIYVILRSYNYRVKKLSRHMEKMKNEKFDPITLQEGKDEIGGLIRNFNLMAAKINSLINDVYKLEIQKKGLELERVRAELNFLQSQMNPHFLFNTLNALLVVSKKNGYNQVADIIKNLSLVLRRLLSWTDDLVTLQEEITFTEMYLKIEKFRFMDRFDFSIDIDPAAASCKIPKMSIQTLAENACKHGLQAVKGVRIIRIRAIVSDRHLQVSVEDNGKGFEENKREEILRALSEDGEIGGHVGILNVYKRLALFYGDRVDFRIGDDAGQWTVVSFYIPLDKLFERSVEGGEAV